MAETGADERVILTPEEAEGLLCDGPHVHNYTRGPIFIGCDYERADAVKAFKTAKLIEIAGEIAKGTRQGHRSRLMAPHPASLCVVIDSKPTPIGESRLHRCETCDRKGWFNVNRLNGRSVICDGEAFSRQTPGGVAIVKPDNSEAA
jgi:hypothetical protein